MRFAYKLLAALAFAMVSASAAAPAWHDLPALTADPSEILHESQALQPKDGQPIQVLLEASTVRFDGEGRKVTHIQQVYRVDQAAALEGWGSVGTWWEPWREDRPLIRARVLTPDGRVHAFDPSTLGEFPLSTQTPKLYDDRRNLAAPLPQVCVGAVVEIEVVHQDKLPELKVGSRAIMRVARPFPVRHLRASVEVPEAMPIHWKLQGLPDAKVVRRVAGGCLRLSLDLGPREADPGDEALEYYANRPEPLLAVTTCPSWAAAAKAYAEIVDGQIHGAELGPWLRDVPGSSVALEERLNAILTRLNRELQYTGVEFGEAALVPRPPAQTLARGYGDCKDQAALLVALLRGLGLQANLALLVAGPDRDADPELPGVLHFNHAIVVVKGPGHNLWVDPTASTCRAGTLPWQDQNRLALIIAPDTRALVRTPQSTVEDNLDVEWREIHLGESGKPARVVETCRPRGYAEAQLRSQFPTRNAGSRRESLTQYLKNAYQAQELGTLELADSDDLSKPFTLTVEGKGCGVGSTWDTGCEITLNLWGITSELRSIIGFGQGKDAPGERKHELLFPLPVGREWRYRVIPPYGYVLPVCPPTETVQFGPASLRSTYALEADGTLAATFRLESGKLLWTAAEVQEARSALERWGQARPLKFEFPQAGEALVKVGRLKEAFAVFRRQIAARPDLAALHSHLALALMEAGLGDAARAEARKGWEQAPESLYTNRALGWILARDLSGRAYASGWDRAGAIQAYEKAVAIDPDDEISWRNLVDVYQRNSVGHLFGPGADREKSIQAIKDYQKHCRNHDQDGNLVHHLLWLGRSEEALAFARSEPEFKDRPKWLAAALLANLKPEAALAELTEAIPKDDVRKAGLRDAAWALCSLRLYPAAAAAAQAGAAGQRDGNEGRLWAADLRQRARHETLNLDPARPETVVREVLQKLLADGPLGPDFHALLAPSFSAILAGAKDAKDLHRFLGGNLSGLKKRDAYADMNLDIAWQESLYAAAPVPWSDAIFRIDIRRPMVGGVEKSTWFVVRSGSRYLVAGHSGWPIGFATAALTSLEHNDLAAARNWLDLALEFARKGDDGDPATGLPFRRLWTRGQQGDADQVRSAAASLLAYDGSDSRAIPLLLAGKGKAADPTLRQGFDFALMDAYWRRKQWPALADQATRLAQEFPHSPHVFSGLAAALSKIPGRMEELLGRCRALVADEPDNVAARSWLATALEGLGREQEREDFLRKVVQAGKATDLEYNNLAWLMYCRGEDINQALEVITKSLQLDPKNYSAANTQAVLLACNGNIADSLSVMRKYMEDQEQETLQPPDWLVLGRIADTLDEPDSARACYRRARGTQALDNDPWSVSALAQKRLDALAAPGEPGRAPR